MSLNEAETKMIKKAIDSYFKAKTDKEDKLKVLLDHQEMIIELSRKNLTKLMKKKQAVEILKLMKWIPTADQYGVAFLRQVLKKDLPPIERGLKVFSRLEKSAWGGGVDLKYSTPANAVNYYRNLNHLLDEIGDVKVSDELREQFLSPYKEKIRNLFTDIVAIGCTLPEKYSLPAFCGSCMSDRELKEYKFKGEPDSSHQGVNYYYSMSLMLCPECMPETRFDPKVIDNVRHVHFKANFVVFKNPKYGYIFIKINKIEKPIFYKSFAFYKGEIQQKISFDKEEGFA